MNLFLFFVSFVTHYFPLTLCVRSLSAWESCAVSLLVLTLRFFWTEMSDAFFFFFQRAAVANLPVWRLLLQVLQLPQAPLSPAPSLVPGIFLSSSYSLFLMFQSLSVATYTLKIFLFGITDRLKHQIHYYWHQNFLRKNSAPFRSPNSKPSASVWFTHTNNPYIILYYLPEPLFCLPIRSSTFSNIALFY